MGRQETAESTATSNFTSRIVFLLHYWFQHFPGVMSTFLSRRKVVFQQHEIQESLRQAIGFILIFLILDCSKISHLATWKTSPTSSCRWGCSSFWEGNRLSDTMLKFSELQFQTSSTSCLVLGKITFLHGVAWRDVDWLSGFAAAKINFKCSDESFLSLTCLQWEWHPVQEIPRILRRIMTKHSQYEGSPLAWGHEGDRLCGPALGLKERK